MEEERRYKVTHKEYYFTTVAGIRKERSRVVYTILTAESKQHAIEKLNRAYNLILAVDFLGYRKEDIYGDYLEEWVQRKKNMWKP